MKDIVLIVLSASLLSLTFVLPVLLARATARRKSFEAHADIFFKKLNALASDDETPIEVLRGFYTMNEMVTMRRGGALLLRALLTRPGSKDDDHPATHEFDTVIAPFMERRPELGRAFADGLRAWMQAILCGASGPSGFLARLLFRNALAVMDPARLVRRVSDTKKRFDDHHNHDHHPAGMAA